MTAPIVTGQELRGIISEAYPRAYTPAIDRRYFLPSEDFAVAQVIRPAIKSLGWKPEVFDCDDVAMVVLGRIKEAQLAGKWAYPMAVGLAIGVLGDGRNHVTNCAVTDQKLVVWLDVHGIDTQGFRPRLVWI